MQSLPSKIKKHYPHIITNHNFVLFHIFEIIWEPLGVCNISAWDSCQPKLHHCVPPPLFWGVLSRRRESSENNMSRRLPATVLTCLLHPTVSVCYYGILKRTFPTGSQVVPFYRGPPLFPTSVLPFYRGPTLFSTWTVQFYRGPSLFSTWAPNFKNRLEGYP